MSRIGKKAIPLPGGVEVKIEGSLAKVKGPKGSLEKNLHPSMKVEVVDNEVRVAPADENQPAANFHGLTRSLLNNMIVGVSTGFSKSLLLRGVGYRATVQGKNLNLTLGYSHPVLYPIPEGLEVKVDKLG